MGNPFDYFQKIYCCTIPQNTERMKFQSEQAVKWSYPLEFVYGTYSPGSQTTVTEQHLKACRDALKNKFERVLILEDDCDFLDATHLEEVLSEWETVPELSPAGSILYLGGWVMGENHPVTGHINMVTKITCLHSYVPTVWMMMTLTSGLDFKNTPLDLFISETFGLKDCLYVARPLMTRQWPSFSNVRGKFDDKSQMQKWSMEALQDA